MKKILFVAIAAMTLMFSACSKNAKDVDINTLDNTINRCWSWTWTYAGVTATNYLWGTEREVAQVLQEAQKMTPVGTYSYKPASAADEEACYKLGEQE